VRPFVNKLDSFLNIISELTLFVLFLLMLVLNSGIGDEDLISWIGIITIIFYFTIHIIVVALRIIDHHRLKERIEMKSNTYKSESGSVTFS
jgi:uncharacterized protein YhhL (DUF1145 family)